MALVPPGGCWCSLQPGLENKPEENESLKCCFDISKMGSGPPDRKQIGGSFVFFIIWIGTEHVLVSLSYRQLTWHTRARLSLNRQRIKTAHFTYRPKRIQKYLPVWERGPLSQQIYTTTWISNYGNYGEWNHILYKLCYTCISIRLRALLRAKYNLGPFLRFLSPNK